MIPPGGEAEIQVTLRPKGRHLQIEKKVIVMTNDPDQPRFPLTMKGTLLIDVVAEPATVAILDLPPGQAGAESFSLQRAEGSTATIESVVVEDAEHFSVREIEAGRGALATYEVHWNGRDEVGTSSTVVVVKTTGEHSPELRIPVRASAAYNLRYPERFGFTVREGKAVERTINISTRRGDAPEIGKVEDLDGLLDVEVLASRGPSTAIKMRLREDAVERAGVGVTHTLRVHTDDPDQPQIDLQYSVLAPRTPLRARPMMQPGTAESQQPPAR